MSPSSLQTHPPSFLRAAKLGWLCLSTLVAKVMVLRMGNALDTVIGGTQTAFVPSRWIGDNVLFHLEELEYVQFFWN